MSTPDPTGLSSASDTLEGVGSGVSSLTSAIFGDNVITEGTTRTVKGADSEAHTFLEIDEEGIQKIIADILGAEGGIADIFNKENIAGIYNSTVAAQASGDLVANLAGEIAKLTADTVQTRADTVVTQTDTEEEVETEGLTDQLNLDGVLSSDSISPIVNTNLSVLDPGGIVSDAAEDIKDFFGL